MIVMTAGSEINISVVKVPFLDKLLLEKSSGVTLIKVNFLWNFAGSVLWIIQKQPPKNENLHGKKAFLI